MHWPPRSFQAASEGTAGNEGVAAAPTTPVGSGGSFSAPPPSDVTPISRLSSPPTSAPAPGGYETMDFSKFSASSYESDGLRDAQLAEQMRGSFNGYWIQNPRARQCVNNIGVGAKMGASVGGCFGLLTGLYVAISQRNVLVLPVSVIGGAVSFGFFLGCGMIIRCEEPDMVKHRLCDMPTTCNTATIPDPHKTVLTSQRLQPRLGGLALISPQKRLMFANQYVE